MTTSQTSHGAEFDAHCIAVNSHIAAICELAEAWISTPDDKKNLSTHTVIGAYENALKAMGLTQADIYSFVNRVHVPAEME